MITWVQKTLPETIWIDGRLFQELGIYPSFVVVFQGSLVSPFALHGCLRKMGDPCHCANSVDNLLQNPKNALIPGSED